jgi:hypothetical protein
LKTIKFAENIPINAVGPFFTFARTLRTPTTFALFQFCFFSLKDNIRGHLPMTIFDYVPYSITADAIWTIAGVQLAFMASAVTLQGT